MSVPVAWVTSPTENGAARSGPPCGCPKAAPTPPSAIVSRASAGRSRSGAASTARSRFGSKATTLGAHLGAVAALHDRLVLAGDHVGVGDHEAVADHEAAPLLDAVARRALDLHGRRDHRVDDRLRDVASTSAAGPTSGARSRAVEDARELVLADQAPQRVDRVGRLGEAVVDEPGDRRRAGLRARTSPARRP